MKTNLKYFSLLVAMGFAISAKADFAADLAAKFPATSGAKIEKSFPGFYSVVKGNEVVFVRDDLSIMINGDVIDLNAQRSLTTQIKDAIKFGQGKNKLYVFSDPDCPFCKQLEQDLGQLQDTQIFIFPFPLTSIHPTARVTAESIWCAEDKAAAWKDYLMQGKKPKFATCDNPISRNLALGEEHQIQGTPALIFEDGTIIPGAIPLQRIQAQINAANAGKK